MTDWYQRRMARHRAEQPQTVPYRPQMPTYPSPSQQTVQQFTQQEFTPPKGMTNIQNLYEMMGHWKGGRAHKVDREPCPECGSNQYFSRVEGHRRGPPPAPHCYNCGYNGLFTQGLASNWGG